MPTSSSPPLIAAAHDERRLLGLVLLVVGLVVRLLVVVVLRDLRAPLQHDAPLVHAPHGVERSRRRGRPRSSRDSRRRAGGRGGGSARAARCPGSRGPSRSRGARRARSRRRAAASEAPPSVTSTPPLRTKSSRFWIPVQPKPPVMSAVEVGVPWLGNCGVFVKASGEKRGSIPVAMSFSAAAGVGEQDQVEALAQAPLAHVLVHDQRVRDLLVVEDHAHPARRLRVAPGLQHREARQVDEVALHVGRARRAVDVDRELARPRSRAPSAGRPGP